MTEPEIRSLRCACGWETTGSFEDLVVAAQEHGQRIHNVVPTQEEIEAMLLPIGPTDHRAEPGSTERRSA